MFHKSSDALVIRTVIDLCDEDEQTRVLSELLSAGQLAFQTGTQLDNGITISVGDIEISVHSNELTFDELEERLFALIDRVDKRFANRDKNYMSYTS